MSNGLYLSVHLMPEILQCNLKIVPFEDAISPPRFDLGNLFVLTLSMPNKDDVFSVDVIKRCRFAMLRRPNPSYIAIERGVSVTGSIIKLFLKPHDYFSFIDKTVAHTMIQKL